MPRLKGQKKAVAIGLFFIAILVGITMLQSIAKGEWGAMVTCLSIDIAILGIVARLRWG